MPLTDADGAVLGSLCAIDHEPRQWTGHDLDLLAGLAAACSDSLRLRIAADRAERAGSRTAELNKRSERAFARSQLLLRASVALLAAETVLDVTATVSRLVSGSLDPAHVGVALRDGGRHLVMAAGSTLPADLGARWSRYPLSADVPPALAVRTRRPVTLNDPAAIQDRFPHLVADLGVLGWAALISVPLHGVHGTLGALTFVWEQPYDIGVDEQAVITTIAGYVAQALQRATLLDEQRTAARTLQQALLTPLPAHNGVQMAARYLSAHRGDQVGGDWYDAVPLPGDRLALVIGDVSGHNIAAAAAMSELRSMLRSLIIDRAEPPSALLARLDRANRALGTPTLATVLLAFLDPAEDGGHDLLWSNAGHPPPTLISPDGPIGLLPGRDPLLGAVRDARRGDHRRHLSPGSTLLLHTDGLVETRTGSIDDGFAALHDFVAGHRESDPGKLADLILRRGAGPVTGDALTSHDDVALLVVATPAGPGRAGTVRQE
jgi:serine phosphatase RsbU (regulator of sigma subunit)